MSSKTHLRFDCANQTATERTRNDTSDCKRLSAASMTACLIRASTTRRQKRERREKHQLRSEHPMTRQCSFIKQSPHFLFSEKTFQNTQTTTEALTIALEGTCERKDERCDSDGRASASKSEQCCEKHKAPLSRRPRRGTARVSRLSRCAVFAAAVSSADARPEQPPHRSSIASHHNNNNNRDRSENEADASRLVASRRSMSTHVESTAVKP